MEVHSGNVSIHGQKIAFRRAGTGPVLMLVHGLAGDSTTWRHVMPTLAERFTVIAPDLQGHGKSGKPRSDYSVGNYATMLRDLLLALGHDRATVVGHSLGGGVAMQFAYQYPERCERLVLVASGGLGPDVSPLLRVLALPGAELVLGLTCKEGIARAGVAVASALSHIGLRPTTEVEEVWRSYTSLADEETRAAFVHTLRAHVDFNGQRVDARDRLHLAASMPTMIVWGEHDGVIPAHHAYEAAERLPGCRVEIFERAGHFPHSDDPLRFTTSVADFVAATEPAQLPSDHVRSVLGSETA